MQRPRTVGPSWRVLAQAVATAARSCSCAYVATALAPADRRPLLCCPNPRGEFAAQSIAQATQQTGDARSRELLRQLEEQKADEARMRGELEALKAQIAQEDERQRSDEARCADLEREQE